MSNINFLAEIDRLREEKQELIQALEELREKAEYHCNCCQEFELNKTDCRYCNYKDFLNIINEGLKDE